MSRSSMNLRRPSQLEGETDWNKKVKKSPDATVRASFPIKVKCCQCGSEAAFACLPHDRYYCHKCAIDNNYFCYCVETPELIPIHFLRKKGLVNHG